MVAASQFMIIGSGRASYGIAGKLAGLVGSRRASLAGAGTGAMASGRPVVPASRPSATGAAGVRAEVPGGRELRHAGARLSGGRRPPELRAAEHAQFGDGFGEPGKPCHQSHERQRVAVAGGRSRGNQPCGPAQAIAGGRGAGSPLIHCGFGESLRRSVGQGLHPQPQITLRAWSAAERIDWHRVVCNLIHRPERHKVRLVGT